MNYAAIRASLDQAQAELAARLGEVGNSHERDALLALMYRSWLEPDLLRLLPASKLQILMGFALMGFLESNTQALSE